MEITATSKFPIVPTSPSNRPNAAVMAPMSTMVPSTLREKIAESLNERLALIYP